MKAQYTPSGVKLLYTPHWPHPPQEAFLWLDVEEALYGGAARGGKSDTLLAAALQYVDVPGYAAIILRRIGPDLYGADGMIERSKEWLAPHLGLGAYNGSHMVWTFPSGATLRFGHMQYEDDKMKYQGHAYMFVGFDELTHFTKTQYTYLFSRLTRPEEGPLSEIPLRMRAASNPGGPGNEWVKQRFISKLTDPEDEMDTPERAARRVFIAARVQDNPSVDIEAYRRSLSNLEPEVRAQLLDGDWDARQPGDWYFGDSHIAAAARLGREYRDQLNAGLMPEPVGGVLHLGIDWGDATGAVLGWPLEGGGIFVVREYLEMGSEPIAATPKILGLNMTAWPFGHARHDASAPQSIRTFHRTAQRIAGPFAPQGPTGVAFSKYKAITSLHLRRLARRAHGVYIDAHGDELPGPQDDAIFVPGPLPGHLAISPDCPDLLRVMKYLERDPKDDVGNWKKDVGQESVDALVALMAPAAKRFRDTLKAKVAA